MESDPKGVREKKRVYNERTKTRHPRTRLNNMYQYHYNLTLEQVEAMLDTQGHRCLICQRVFYKLMVDHDHKTGKVRGMLCSRCNAGLGCFKEDTTAMLAAWKYVMDHNMAQRDDAVPAREAA